MKKSTQLRVILGLLAMVIVVLAFIVIPQMSILYENQTASEVTSYKALMFYGKTMTIVVSIIFLIGSFFTNKLITLYQNDDLFSKKAITILSTLEIFILVEAIIFIAAGIYAQLKWIIYLNLTFIFIYGCAIILIILFILVHLSKIGLSEAMALRENEELTI